MQVVAPAAGAPAERAGIRAQDLVVAIDGTPTAGLSLYDVADRLQGPEGSEVVLRVTPRGGTAPVTYTLTRCAYNLRPHPRWRPSCCSRVSRARLRRNVHHCRSCLQRPDETIHACA